MALLEVESLGKSYNSDTAPVEAIREISFAVERGEFMAIIGPSGCGKSTLIKIIGDIIEPSQGAVRVAGLTAGQARLQGKFSFVFQNPVLLPWRRVIDNVRLPLEILHRQARDPAQLLDMVGLAGFERIYPHQLSGGMRQRVALARALTFDPQVLLMDEPFGAVDELTRNGLNEELIRIWQDTGVTVLLVTHSIAEAVFMADRVLLLTPRPARIKCTLEPPFVRPRHPSLKEQPEFQDAVKYLREQLECANSSGLHPDRNAGRQPALPVRSPT